MPKDTVTDTGGTSGPAIGSTPATLPVPGAASSSAPPGPTLTIPPGPTGPIPSGPVIIDPPGTPISNGAFGGPIVGGPPMPGGILGQPSDPSRWYVAAEAMAVWIKSYGVPALVTTGPAFSGANLSVHGVTSLFGADTIQENPRYGGQLTLGYWLNPCWAVELSGFYVRPSTHRFTALSGSFPNSDLARPFFSANRGIESSEIVGRPGVASGFIQIDEKSNFYGAELNARTHYWQGCNNSIDLIGGLRFLYLDERLTISEQTTGLAGAGPLAGVSSTGADQFHTKNRFYGAQVGAIFTHVEGPWTFDLKAKVAAGVTRSIVDINGSTSVTSGGPLPTRPGAQQQHRLANPPAVQRRARGRADRRVRHQPALAGVRRVQPPVLDRRVSSRQADRPGPGREPNPELPGGPRDHGRSPAAARRRRESVGPGSQRRSLVPLVTQIVATNEASDRPAGGLLASIELLKSVPNSVRGK
jgi:hypothetical protein